MSALDDLFAEEYERLKRMQSAMERELDRLPKGYLSKKNIGGKQYYYFQRRSGSKIVSSYVAPSVVKEYEAKIARRKQLEASVRECKANIIRLEKVMKHG